MIVYTLLVNDNTTSIALMISSLLTSLVESQSSTLMMSTDRETDSRYGDITLLSYRMYHTSRYCVVSMYLIISVYDI